MPTRSHCFSTGVVAPCPHPGPSRPKQPKPGRPTGGESTYRLGVLCRIVWEGEERVSRAGACVPRTRAREKERALRRSGRRGVDWESAGSTGAGAGPNGISMPLHLRLRTAFMPLFLDKSDRCPGTPCQVEIAPPLLTKTSQWPRTPETPRSAGSFPYRARVRLVRGMPCHFGPRLPVSRGTNAQFKAYRITNDFHKTLPAPSLMHK